MSKNLEEPLNLILVGGIYGEILSLPFIGNYMKPIGDALKTQFNIQQVSYLQPHFWQCRDQVSLSISNEVMRAKCLQGLNSLVIGHSKGATDALFSVWSHPEIFLSDAVKGLLLLSPPVKGSFFAHWIHKTMPLFSQLLGLDKLTPENSFQTLVDACKNQALKGFLKEKVISVSTIEEKTSKVTWVIKLSHWLSRKKGHSTDGLLTIDEQDLDQPLLAAYTHRSHHGYLTNESVISSISDNERADIFQKIVQKFNLSQSSKADISIFPIEKKIKVGTYNLGLLPIPIWGVPYSKERLHALPETLRKNNFDVLCLQEVFGNKAREILAQEFFDYYIFSSPVKPHIGLVTLVRKDLFPEVPDIQVTYKSFRKQRRAEVAFGFGKGYLQTRLVYKNMTLSFVNLHLTAFPSAKKIRRDQASELLSTIHSEDSVTFLCGDYNENLGLGVHRPTFRENNSLNKIKRKWLQEKSNRLDYVVPVASAENLYCEMLSEEILLKSPEVAIGKGRFVEQSDHDLVVSEFGLYKDLRVLNHFL